MPPVFYWKRIRTMYAVEFEVDITDKFIEIKDYEKVANKHARVIIIVEDVLMETTKTSVAGDLKKYAKPELIDIEKDVAWEKLAKDKNNNT